MHWSFVSGLLDPSLSPLSTCVNLEMYATTQRKGKRSRNSNCGLSMWEFTVINAFWPPFETLDLPMVQIDMAETVLDFPCVCFVKASFSHGTLELMEIHSNSQALQSQSDFNGFRQRILGFTQRMKCRSLAFEAPKQAKRQGRCVGAEVKPQSRSHTPSFGLTAEETSTSAFPPYKTTRGLPSSPAQPPILLSIRLSVVKT